MLRKIFTYTVFSFDLKRCFLFSFSRGRVSSIYETIRFTVKIGMTKEPNETSTSGNLPLTFIWTIGLLIGSSSLLFRS